MAITNYQELQAAIAGWLERSDLSDRIPDFISLTERRIMRHLRTPGNERTLIYERTAADGDELLIPPEYLECKRLLVNGVKLQRLTDGQFYSREARQGQPTHFFRYANRLKVWPTPGADYQWVLTYYMALTLDDTNPTHTLLTVAPDLFLFGALMEAEPYLMNDARLPLWQDRFDRALRDIQDMAEEAEIAGSASISNGAYT